MAAAVHFHCHCSAAPGALCWDAQAQAGSVPHIHTHTCTHTCASTHTHTHTTYTGPNMHAHTHTCTHTHAPMSAMHALTLPCAARTHTNTSPRIVLLPPGRCQRFCPARTPMRLFARRTCAHADPRREAECGCGQPRAPLLHPGPD